MTERFVPSGELRLWTERSGDPGAPAVLLIMGAAAQGITCPDALVERLVARGWQVIRFDHRDTGRSSTVDFDEHPYGLADMADDCLAVLDAYGLPKAHLAGASMGGMLAQWLAVHEPGRVQSLTLIGSSPIIDDWDELPRPAPHFRDYIEKHRDDPPGVEADVDLFRVMNGDVLEFDEPGARAMLELAWSRAVDPAAAAHHHRAAAAGFSADLSAIAAPTMIVHGDQDPIFSLGHAEALKAAVPHAELVIIPGMGHVLFSPGLPERLADLIAGRKA